MQIPILPRLSPGLARFQLDCMRRMSGARGAALTFALSDEWKHDVCDSLRALHPFADDREIGVLWIEYAYGYDLASKFRSHLVRTGRWHSWNGAGT